LQRVIALGFFDGVHLGHATLLRCARVRAEALGVSCAALTFDLHPDTLVTGKAVPLLNHRADREWLLRSRYGMDEVLLLHFDRETMRMPWDAFVRDYLVQRLGACHVVCGHDFHFGDRGEGNPERLKALCAELGIGCDVIERVTLGGETVSSTLIRSLIADGEVERANAFLGHPHILSGTVVPGKQLGRTIGIPTANLCPPDGLLLPRFGVYATRVDVGDAVYPAVTNVGVRPTVRDMPGVTVEPWILGFDGDLYGKTIRVEFHQFLRGETKFPDIEALREEIMRNADQTRAYFAEKA
jgi:riboflavin kinase/FMN adenylyltransferase